MKGHFFNLLEDFICEGWGEVAYERILRSSSLQTTTPFVGPSTYPDADLVTLVGAASTTLGIPVDHILRQFGAFCFPRLASRSPVFMKGHTHPKSFLKTIDTVIHIEIRKLMREARPPRIVWEEPGPDELVLVYSSERQMCQLMAGLLDGTATYFKSPFDYAHDPCMRDGAEACRFHLRFRPPE